MSFSNAITILTQVQTDIKSAISLLLPTASINLDEPLNLVYTDLPAICIYPVKEDFIEESASQSQDMKQLYIRIEVRMAGSPSSTLCTPIINAISDIIKTDRTLGGLVYYVERQSINWASEQISQGPICGASLDIRADYFI